MGKEQTMSMWVIAGVCAVLTASACMILSPSTARADEAGEREAVVAAGSWLMLVDGGEYGESWETASALFRAATTKAQWQQALTAARKPLGGLVVRTVKSTRYATSLPGAPDGEYVVIQYQTSFANRRSAIETVTPMRDGDGTWRVSGYFIR